jgi:hypothetical protein
MPLEATLPNYEDNRVAKNNGRERKRQRELNIKIQGGGAGGDTCNARVGPTSYSITQSLGGYIFQRI